MESGIPTGCTRTLSCVAMRRQKNVQSFSSLCLEQKFFTSRWLRSFIGGGSINSVSPNIHIGIRVSGRQAKGGLFKLFNDAQISSTLALFA